MNGVIITEKNFDSVASRMIKFFDGADIIQWHSFDCGMKRHIPTDFVMNIGRNEGKRFRCVYRYPHVSAKVVKSAEAKYIAIRLNSGCGWRYQIGDIIKFCGDRIQTRTKFLAGNFKWCYDVYQRWSKNGGFGDMRPEHEEYYDDLDFI